MKWSLVQRGLFFGCRGGPNAYIMQLKFMGWAYKKEAAAQFICATAPSLPLLCKAYISVFTVEVSGAAGATTDGSTSFLFRIAMNSSPEMVSFS